MENEASITELLQKLKNRDLLGKSLADKDRLHVVGYLKSRGESCASIGALLGYSDRQIRRIFEEFRKANAYQFSTESWAEEIGSFVRATETAKEFLLRVYHDPNREIGDRIAAASALWRRSNETIVIMFKLGCFMPSDFSSRQRGHLELADPKKEYGSGPFPMEEIDHLITKHIAVLPPMERERLIEKVGKALKERDDSDRTKENTIDLRREMEKLEKDAKASQGKVL